MNQELFERQFRLPTADGGPAENCFVERAKRSLRQEMRCEKLTQRAIDFVPILRWLPRYSPCKDLHSDLVTGLTIGVMVVPQCLAMAYAVLAGVAPIYGLYSCFFAAFIYMFMGTSHHVSVGTFAVASMMVGAAQSCLIAELSPVVLRSTEAARHNTLLSEHVDAEAFDFELTPIVVTSSLTLLVGIIQVVMGVCRLSFLTNYISDSLVSGFTTGAALHVFFSQLPKVLGVEVPRQNGPAVVAKVLFEVVKALPETNLWTAGIALFGLMFMSIGRDYVNPWFKSRFHIPLPLELFLVVVSILFSRSFDIYRNHNVKIVAHVPEGMPMPSLPRVELFPYLWHNAITISIICYIFLFSMGKIFAKKHRYRVDTNQELYALGVAEILSSFFPVYPCGASLSRSSLCDITGARTPLHAIFSSAMLLVVILWLGPLLEPLPMATLSCIVIVSLKNLLLQFRELPKLWRISMTDFFVWIIAFMATTFIDVTSGLIVGMVFVIFTVVLREQWPQFKRLHMTPTDGGDVFRPVDLYKGSLSIEHGPVAVLKFESPLHFANASKFVDRCAEVCAELTSASITSDDATAVGGEGKVSTVIMESFPYNVMVTSANGDTLSLPMVMGAGNGNSPPLSPNSSAININSVTPMVASLKPNSTAEPEGNCRTASSELHNIFAALSSSVPLLSAASGGDRSFKKKASIKLEPIRRSNNATLIVDCGSIAFIDSSGVDALVEAFNDSLRMGVNMKYAGFSDTILNVLSACKFFGFVAKSNFYPSVKEAYASLGTACSASENGRERTVDKSEKIK